MQRGSIDLTYFTVSAVAMKHLPQTWAQLFVLAAKSQPCNPKWPQSITRVAHKQHAQIHTRKDAFSRDP